MIQPIYDVAPASTGDSAALYLTVYALVDTLDAADETTRSARIRQALRGTSDDDILPLLRHEVRELRASGAARRLRLEGRLDTLLHDLDGAVARYGYR